MKLSLFLRVGMIIGSSLHVWVSLGYIILFTIMSIIPWLLRIGIHTGFGLLLFFVSIIGQLYMALNIYLTRIRMKEIITVIKNRHK